MNNKHICKLCQTNPVHNPDTACAECDEKVWAKLWANSPSKVTVRLAQGRRAVNA